MDISIMKFVNNGERVLSTECIFCLTCTTVCPEGILEDTFKMDIGGKEYIHATCKKKFRRLADKAIHTIPFRIRFDVVWFKRQNFKRIYLSKMMVKPT